jgi:hypothetical protein
VNERDMAGLTAAPASPAPGSPGSARVHPGPLPKMVCRIDPGDLPAGHWGRLQRYTAVSASSPGTRKSCRRSGEREFGP